MRTCTIGVDFGTLSGRALLLDIHSGEELASAVFDYPHGVMDRQLPDGTPLENDWALQHPADYWQVLENTVPAVLRSAGVTAEEVVGIGIDFTASTVLPVTETGVPLCVLPDMEHIPHAYVKLWKHHAAQPYASRMTDEALRRHAPWLSRYGGKISSEWAVPKLWQTLEEAPQVCEAAAAFVEAADWIVWQLTGKRSTGACAAGYKALWDSERGYPDAAYFSALDPRLEELVRTKLMADPLPLGACAGYLTEKAAASLGLRPGIAVAAANVDAHACVPAAGIDGPGTMLAIMGTSTCHMVLSEQEMPVPGICGVVRDGILPGYYGYEAGQSCVGDCFAWYMRTCLPAEYAQEAAARGMDIHAFLREKAQKLEPGESGLLALDWWNGNRSVLVDAGLSGMLLGMTLQTRPEEIYRALIEATAFGTRVIVENSRAHGVPVHAFAASGGIARKDPMTMQIYADVLNMPVQTVGSSQGPALGAAMFGAVAAGEKNGGFRTIFEAVRTLRKPPARVYLPDPRRVRLYDALFADYKEMHDFFGRGGSAVMKRLRAMKNRR